VSPIVRRGLFVAAATVLAGLLVWGLAGLPAFTEYHGPYGDAVTATVVPERQATAAVGAVNFDYRAYDTLGEEFILFAAVVGVAALFRLQREEEEARPEDQDRGRRVPHTSDALQAFGLAAVGPTVLLGLYVVAHGHLTPGGGFQGGVILASALLLVYLSEEYFAMARVRPIALVELAEAAGAGGLALIGLAGLVFGGSFFLNFLPLGTAGSLLSAGTILAGNLAVGLAVAGGFVLLLSEFLEQAIIVRGRGGRRPGAGGSDRG
jgi:multicomponent Na+:H+ antiporter subunit B